MARLLLANYARQFLDLRRLSGQRPKLAFAGGLEFAAPHLAARSIPARFLNPTGETSKPSQHFTPPLMRLRPVGRPPRPRG